MAEVVSVGANEWAVVSSRFEESRGEIDTFRDQDSLRKKFDKLVSSMKNTRDNSLMYGG